MRAIINTDLQNHFGGNARTDFLTQGQSLLPGDQLISPNGLFKLIYQSDGNLVLYNLFNNTAYWSTGTITQIPGMAIYQTDGNFVVYSSSSLAMWSINVLNYGNGTLTLQNDGNLVIYKSDNSVAWQSNTPLTLPAMTRNVLVGDDKMMPGDLLMSNNKYFRFIYQTDGNLVLYRWDNQALWNSNTQGQSVGYVIMQLDGNFCIYPNGQNPTAIWSSGNISNAAGSRLELQDDGNVVIYNPNKAVIWNTNTVTTIPSGAKPFSIVANSQCGALATPNSGVSNSICGAVVSGTDRCAGVISGSGLCGAVYSAASVCGAASSGASSCFTVLSGANVCGSDLSIVGVCGLVAAGAAANMVAIAAAGVCGAVTTIVGLCGAVMSGVGASVIGAAAANLCGIVACGAAACAADVAGVEVCIEMKAAGVCGANAIPVTGSGVCGAQVGFCGAVLCMAFPVGGNW